MRPAPFVVPSALQDALAAARRIVVLTGAGISAESGVPTFRDAQTGLWARFRSEELATPDAFRSNPKLVWEWYTWRRSLLATAQPNAGHHALVELERRLPDFTLVTQNVDGLHRQAGSQRVIELHGNIARTRCFDENTLVEVWDDQGEVPPRCPRCGGMLRPDVVWFQEALPAAALTAATRASEACDLFLSIGTSGLVYPAASLPLAALAAGSVVVDINTEPTPLAESASHVLRGPAGTVLPALVRCILR